MEKMRVFCFVASNAGKMEREPLVLDDDASGPRRDAKETTSYTSSTLDIEGEGEGEEEETVIIHISELLDADYSCYTWPSSAVMAQFISHYRHRFPGKVLLEISSGTSLCGILAAKLGAASVILSEYPLPLRYSNGKPNDIFQRLQRQADINHVSNVHFANIIWGEVTHDLLYLLPSSNLDFIILSDSFFDACNFTHLLFTIRFLLERFPMAECWLTYQIRDEDWNLHSLLETFGLRGRFVPLKEFGGDCGKIAGSNLPGDVEVVFYQLYLFTQTRLSDG